MAKTAVAPPVITAPQELALTRTVAVPGCSVADPFAATAGGAMALNVSCAGTLHLPDGSSGSALNYQAPLDAINAALAAMLYTPPDPAISDTISINVWNQAGLESTEIIQVVLAGIAPPRPEQPPEKPPGQGSDTGVQAERIADLLATAGGANMFPSMDPDSNVWGSYPADYSPESVLAAMDWLTADSPAWAKPVSRIYAASYRMDILRAWLPVVAAKGYRFTAAIAANGTADDAKAVLELAADPKYGIVMVEGINEPNTDFGSGVVPADVTIEAQRVLFAGRPHGMPCAGPSIVFGLPFPEGYITPGYASAEEMADICANMDVANGHFYPPNVCDLDDGSGRGGAFDDVVAGLRAAYGVERLAITEYQPTLYRNASAGQIMSSERDRRVTAPTPHGTDDRLDGYYAPIMLLSAFRLRVGTMQWYPLFDYGTLHPCGFFPQTHAADARPSAWAIRALHALAGDPDPEGLVFTPERLDYQVSGGSPPINDASPHTGTQSHLFQGADGRFRLFITNEQLEPGGTPQPVRVSFGAAVLEVREHEIRPDAGFVDCIGVGTACAEYELQPMGATTRLLLVTVE
jgi:hypothetical protein